MHDFRETDTPSSLCISQQLANFNFSSHHFPVLCFGAWCWRHSETDGDREGGGDLVPPPNGAQSASGAGTDRIRPQGGETSTATRSSRELGHHEATWFPIGGLWVQASMAKSSPRQLFSSVLHRCVCACGGGGGGNWWRMKRGGKEWSRIRMSRRQNALLSPGCEHFHCRP